MVVEFRKGDAGRPVGHALIYFDGKDGEVWATYVVIMPINVDVSKYVPPFLMNQLGEIGPQDLSAFAFPPAPEQIGDLEVLDRMASSRDDDILYAGTYDGVEVTEAMTRINDVVQQYAESYVEITGGGIHTDAASSYVQPEEQSDSLVVSDVLYDFMSDDEKLGQLTKLVGQLRFAVDGADITLLRETESEIVLLARHLPDAHEIPKLVDTLKSNATNAPSLAESYLQRSYHLVREDYSKLAEIEKRIKSLELESQ